MTQQLKFQQHNDFKALRNENGDVNIVLDYMGVADTIVSVGRKQDGAIALRTESGFTHLLASCIAQDAEVVYLTQLTEKGSLQCIQLLPEIAYD